MSSARNVVDQIVDDIVQDATKTLRKVTRYVAKRAADDWEAKAKNVWMRIILQKRQDITSVLLHYKIQLSEF